MEIVEFSRICEEDLDIGSGTRQIRLQDGSLATLRQVSLASLLSRLTTLVTLTNGAASVSASGLLPAGARIAGVTIKHTTAPGTSLGLTAITVGDGAVMDRWGRQTTLTQDAETDQGHFTIGDWPVYPSTTDVVLTALGGTFDGTGVVEVTTHYFYLAHRSAA